MASDKRPSSRSQDSRRRRQMKTLGLALVFGILISALLGLGLWFLNRR